ncbi:MAG TPA: amino acid adenylation domain-containing protein [Acidisarcina sp.]
MDMHERPGYFLSPQQSHLWLLQQASQKTFVAQIAVLLQGTLDLLKLREAFRASVARHEILRTIFRRQAGMKTPFQVILDELDPVWEVRSAVTTADPLQSAKELLTEEANLPFDFERGPLLRVIISRIASGSHIVAVTLPALCADAASLTNLVKEVLASYTGAPAAGDVEPLRYVQFAQWQSELLEGKDDAATEGKAFWSKHSAIIEERPVMVPYESRHDAPGREKLHAGESHDVGVLVPHIPVDLAAKISSVATAMEVSQSEVLLAAWQSLISRLTANSVAQVGVLASSREYEELADALGLIAKVLPVSSRIEPGLRFKEVMLQTHKALEEATSWQEYFDPGKSAASASPISFAYYDIPLESASSSLAATLLQIKAESGPVKLKLVCVRTASLALEFHYDTASFGRAGVELIAGYLINLLTAAVNDPSIEMELLPLLSEAERKQILYGWNSTAAPWPPETIHSLIEEQAARTRDRIALRCGDETLTYAQLDAGANQLAHHLRKLGVEAGSLVGLCLDRSVSMMLAVVAILKAGGAYIPLNRDQPAARLEQQLTGATVLLTEQKYEDLKALSFGSEPGGAVLYLDSDASQWSNEPDTPPAPLATPEDLVYVIYTSGSTGTPKGVAVRHRNLVNYARAIADQLKLAEFPGGLQFATVSTLAADLGNTSIYPALISGGALHVIPYETGTDVRRMARYQEKYPIDVLKIVPSHLTALLASAEGGQVLPKKFLITGGEMLTRGLVEKIMSSSPTCQIINHYGPTETTVGSLTFPLSSFDLEASSAASIPIGRPIANTQVYVLDGRLQPGPEGVTGELYISGAGLTAGYLGDPKRTAERFVPNPFIDGALMYRTGDLVRFVPGERGVVEFLGRADDQVKIRGFRVEPGEIEATLLRIPGVRQAVVLAREAATEGDKQLVAYVVATRQGEVTADALRQSLKDQLPEYMVPFAILVLDKLPLTPNGKIDRNALPHPDEAAPEKEHVEPATDTEREIARIWAEVLHRPNISAEDNFFNLGGHSLTGTQVISRIREHFLVELAFRALFEYPTLRTLAASVDAQKGEPTVAAGPIRRAPREAYRG